MGEHYQLAFAQGALDVFGNKKVAIETKGEHSAQGGAIALSIPGLWVVKFTSGQGLIYGLEPYCHGPPTGLRRGHALARNWKPY